MKKSNKGPLVYGGLLLISLLAAYGLYYLIALPEPGTEALNANSYMGGSALAKPKMTEFDIQLARKLMDKDNDGRCDFCGMDVRLCIDSGMLECTMGPNAKIGLLHSAHEHADFKVFLNGEAINFNQQKYFVKSAFAHVEPEENAAEIGNVLHIHATGVPLWLFFESLGMKFNSSCFVLDSGKEFCNNASYRLRFFVNGKENNEFENYVPKNLDKILIAYGSNDDEIARQLESITGYARTH